MNLRLLFFFILLHLNCIAQKLSLSQEKIVRGVIAQHFNEEIANSTTLHQGASTFAMIDNDTLLSIQGYHYLYKLKGDTIERLDRSFFHGGNFERYLYTYDGKVHLMGGYGLFNTNNNIEMFDPKNREWSVVKTTGQKPPFIRGMCLRISDYLYSFYNSKSGNNIEEDIYDPYIYRLNLKQNNWERFENINPTTTAIFDKIYTTDYCIGILLNTIILINKKTAHYISLPREVLRVSLREHFNTSIHHNTLVFQNYLTSHSNSITYNIDVDSLWKKQEKNAQLFVLEPAWYQTPKLLGMYLIGIAMLLLGVWLFYRYRKKSGDAINKGINSLSIDATNPTVEKILSATKTTLDIDELDALLEINHMEFDSRKLKRHRLLSDLEKTNPGLIIRQKDETDKRRFIYIIQKN